MKIEGIQCDVCCKQHLFDMRVREHDIPMDWLTLFYGNPTTPLRSGINFCSLKCLSDWVGKQLIAASPIANDPDYNERLNAVSKSVEEAEHWGNW